MVGKPLSAPVGRRRRFIARRASGYTLRRQVQAGEPIAKL
jgi:hypothetical protein